MFDFFTSALSYIKSASPYIKDIASIGKDVAGAYSAYESYKAAGEQADLQREELARNQMLQEAAARKEARVKTARLLASGIDSSSVEMGVIGVGSSLESGLTDLSERTAFNVGSVGLQESAAKTQATFSGVGSTLNAAAGTVEFSDLLASNVDATGDLFNAPSGSFENRG